MWVCEFGLWIVSFYFVHFPSHYIGAYQEPAGAGAVGGDFGLGGEDDEDVGCHFDSIDSVQVRTGENNDRE